MLRRSATIGGAPLFSLEGAALLVALLGLLAGLAACAAGGIAVHRLYAPQLDRAQQEATMLRDRLLQAWQEGYTVPDAVDLQRETRVEQPFPALVLGFRERFVAGGWGVFA